MMEDSWFSRLLRLVTLINQNPEIAGAKRIPSGYGTLRKNSFSGMRNDDAIRHLIRSEIHNSPGRYNFDHLEILRLFENERV